MNAHTQTATDLQALQADADEAGGSYGRGMRDYEVGKISPAELGLLKRRLKRAEARLQSAKVEAV